MVKKYQIHDNFARPFEVSVDGNTVSIVKGKYNESKDEYDYNKEVKVYTVDNIWIGKSSGPPHADHSKAQAKLFVGNSILLQIAKKRYVYIGDSIYEFDMEDEVEKYFSLIGRNDVPYPVLRGSKNVYFMLDRKYVPRDEFPDLYTDKEWENAYSTYYGVWDPVHHVRQGSFSKMAKKMKHIKTIAKREF
jgi:hypothetical protein